MSLEEVRRHGIGAARTPSGGLFEGYDMKPILRKEKKVLVTGVTSKYSVSDTS